MAAKKRILTHPTKGKSSYSSKSQEKAGAESATQSGGKAAKTTVKNNK